MQRVLFIYNRHAGKNKTWASLSDIINAMTEQDCLVTTYPTQYRGDAGEAIVRWSGDFDRVGAAGGDGTLSEAVAGAARLPQPPLLGYIPVGTTNDFAKNLNLPLDSLTDLAVTAVTGVPCTHDMGRFNGQPFLYVAAFGAFTEIAYSTPQKNKNLLGYNAYVLEVVKSLSSIKPYHIKVESEDQTIEGDYLYGMVSNTTSVGRFRNFPPGNPDLSDGSKCVVVKESFGNAFVPFLVDHYQTVYVIDYRYYSGSVVDFAKTNKATDVIFVNNLSAIRGSYQMGKLAGVK